MPAKRTAVMGDILQWFTFRYENYEEHWRMLIFQVQHWANATIVQITDSATGQLVKASIRLADLVSSGE